MEFDLKGSGFNVFMRRWATGVSFWFLGGVMSTNALRMAGVPVAHVVLCY